MVLVYTVLTSLLALVHWFFQKRADRSKEKHSVLVLEYDAASKKVTEKGATDKDVLRAEHKLICKLAEADAAEASHECWSSRLERLGVWRGRLKGWAGRTVSYATACFDFLFLPSIIERYLDWPASDIVHTISTAARFW